MRTGGFSTIAAGTCRGTHVPSTRLVPSGDRSDSTALRMMAGLPGRRSRRPTVTGIGVGTGIVDSCMASRAVTFM
jgi:hypothetical protein